MKSKIKAPPFPYQQCFFFHILIFVYFLDLAKRVSYDILVVQIANPLTAYPQDSRLRPFGAKIKLKFGRLATFKFSKDSVAKCTLSRGLSVYPWTFFEMAVIS